jgi:ESCRT-II complex subunit VPS36
MTPAFDANSTSSDNRGMSGICACYFFKKQEVFLTKSLLAGILRTVETSAKGRENHMKDALQDLEALMVKAKDMVKLAAELNEKLTAATAAATSSSSSMLASSSTLSLVSQPEEVTFIRSSLSQLGVQISNTSVTLDMMKDERKWFDELARELARVLQGHLTYPATMGIPSRGG